MIKEKVCESTLFCSFQQITLKQFKYIAFSSGEGGPLAVDEEITSSIPN